MSLVVQREEATRNHVTTILVKSHPTSCRTQELHEYTSSCVWELYGVHG